MIHAIKSGLNQVLGVMAEKFKGGKHGNAAVLELRELASLKFFLVEFRLASIEVSKETIVIDSTNEEENLGPSKSWDSVDCSNTVGNGRAWNSRGNVKGETVDFLYDVSNHSKLCNTAMFELSSAVLGKSFLINVIRKSKWVKESSWCNDTELILVRGGHEGAFGGNLGCRSKGSSRADKEGSSNGELHDLLCDGIRDKKDVLVIFLRRKKEQIYKL